MKQTFLAFLVSVAMLSCRSAAAPPPVAPAPAAAPATSKTPVDSSANEPTEPTEREIPGYTEPPAPQQSPAEEKAQSNAPGEATILSVDPKLLLDGKDFPPRAHYEVNYAEPEHTYYVFANASVEGDGSEGHPWKQLQTALCRLMPGDRLILLPAIYEGNFVIGEGCQDGTAAKPIQLFAHDSFFKSPEAGTTPTLTMRRAFWQFYEIQIGMGHSHPTGFLVEGPGAHDISIDHSHLYEGEGAALHLHGVRNVTLSNSHIHHSRGVDIDGGSSGITLVGNHIHHNRTTALRIGTDPAPESVSDLTITGNKFHNDRGQAIVFGNCRNVRVAENKIYNYRKGEDWEGIAIDLRGGAHDLTFLSNYVMESDTGIRIGSSAHGRPANVSILRDFFENTLTPDAVAIEIGGASQVRIANDMFSTYGTALKFMENTDDVMVVNSIFLTRTAWQLAGGSHGLHADHNLFAGTTNIVVGNASIPIAEQISQMPGSRTDDHLDFSSRDLATLGGTAVVDAGRSFDWIQHKGTAPDIGIDEK